MSTLTGNQIRNTYDSLLKLEDNDGLNANKKKVTDGLGNETPLSISETEIVSSVNVEASGFKTPTGTSSQVLLADGSTTTLDVGSTQEIFKNVAVSGQSTIVADSNNDTLTFIEGSNVTITTDDATDSITIASSYVDTTYTAGAGLDLVGTEFSHSDTSSATNLTGSSRTYVDGLTFDDYGHVTGYTTSTETVVDTDTTYTAGNGLDLTGTVFSHEDTSSVTDLTPSSRTYVDGITFDDYGHIQSISTSSETLTGTVDGSGTANYVAKWSDADTITTSLIYDNGTNVGIGTTSPEQKTAIFTSNESLYDVLGVYNSVTGTSALGKGAAIRIGESTSGTYSTKIATIYEGNNPSFLQPALAFFTMNNTYLKGSEVERMRISANGNVGIGTTSPAQKLDVNGAIAVKGKRVVHRDNNITYLGSVDTGDSVRFRADGSDKMTIDTSGKVGIGTTSPSVNLHVESATSAQFKVGNGTQFVRLYADADEATILADGSVDMRFYTGGSEKMRISSGGNVGIGTTSPGRKLAVAGAIELTSSDMTIHTGHAAIRRGNAGEMFLDAPGDISVTIDTNNNNTDRVFNVRKDTGAELFRVQENGNVGIGTASPSTNLHVKTTSNAQGITIQRASTTAGAYGQLNFLVSTSDIANPNVYLRGVRGATFDDNYLTINTNYAERIRVLGNGNVGIGTTSPTAKLTVNSGSSDEVIRLDHGSVTGNPYISFYQNGTRRGFIQQHDTSNRMNVASEYGPIALKTGTGGAETTKIEIATNGAIQFNSYGSGTFTGTAAQRLGVDSSGNIIEIPIGSGAVDGGGTANYVTKWSDADTITSSSIYDNSGIVTIGSTEQGWSGNPLNVGSTSNGSSGINILTSATGNAYIIFSDVVDGTSTEYANQIRFSHTDNFLAIQTVGSERLRIDSDGNVGIGTDSVTSGVKLEVKGEADTRVRLTGTTTATRLDWATDSHHRFFQLIESDGRFRFYDQTNGAERLTIDSSGNVGIGETNPIAALHINKSGVPQLLLDGGGNTTGDIVVPTGEILQIGHWAPSTSTYTDRLRIAADGNVGIGTTSPNAKLHIEGDGSIIRLQNNNSDTNGTFIDFRDSTGARTGYVGTTGAGDDMFLFTQGAKPIRFHTNTSERMRISSSGNVGIGTTSPTNGKLVIDSAANQIAVETGTAGDGRLNIGHFSNGTFIGTYGDDGGAADLIRFGTHSGDERMRITSDGRVGIGTTSPNHLLDVEKAGASARVYNLTSDGNTDLYLTTTGTTGASRLLFGDTADNDIGKIIYRNNGDSMAFETNAGERMRITSTGNVGIGTTSPDSKLHIVNPNGGSYRFGYGGSSDVYFDSDTVYFRTDNGGANLMTSNVNGLGIGTTSPDQKLHVAGNARITGAIYDGANTAGTSGQILSSTGTKTAWIDAPSGGGIDGAGVAGAITKWTDSDSIEDSDFITESASGVQFGTDALTYVASTKRIGINTSSPSVAFDCAGAAKFQSSFYDGSNNLASSGKVLTGTATGECLWADANSLAYRENKTFYSSWKISTSATEFFRHTTSGAGSLGYEALMPVPYDGTLEQIVLLASANYSNISIALVDYSGAVIYNSGTISLTANTAYTLSPNASISKSSDRSVAIRFIRPSASNNGEISVTATYEWDN